MIGPNELVVLAILALVGGLWIWALVDCLQNEPSEGNDRIVWVLVILLANIVDALIYLLMRRPRRMQQFGR